MIFPTLHLKAGLPIVNFCSLSPPRPTREAQLKKKKGENLDFIKPTHYRHFIRAFRWNDLHILGSNYEKSNSLQMSLQGSTFFSVIYLKTLSVAPAGVWPPAADRHSANCYELTILRKSEGGFFNSHCHCWDCEMGITNADSNSRMY